MEFWHNSGLTGTPVETHYYSDINTNWGGGLITATQRDNVSGRFLTYLVPPVDGMYTIYYLHDNEGRLFFENVKRIDNWVNVVAEDSFTETLVANKKYKVVLEFFNGGGPGEVKLSWAYPGQTKIEVPSTRYELTEFVNGSPMDVTSAFQNTQKVCDTYKKTDSATYKVLPWVFLSFLI